MLIDFLQTTTIERLLVFHFNRTGRNSILMDGEVGLTVDTRIEDIKCLGLGVYAFWEIVKVERWWEYTVPSTDSEERSRSMKKAKHEMLFDDTVPSAMKYKEMKSIKPKKVIQNTSKKPHSIEKKEEKLWSWETAVPSIKDNKLGARAKETMRELSKNKSSIVTSITAQEEESKEQSEVTLTERPFVMIAGQKRKRRKMTKREMLQKGLAQEDRAEIIKSRRTELESDTTINETIKRIRTELDKKLDLMKLKNERAPAIETLKPFAENTESELIRHDDYVTKQRKKMEANSQKFGELQFKDTAVEDILQKFEISWERQRQDIINEDPQFKQRVKSESQDSTGKGTPNFQGHGSLDSSFQEREIHIDLETIQRQLDIAKRNNPQSKFTIRYSRNIVYLDCAYCPSTNIQIGLKESRNIAGIVKRHQLSKGHTDNRYHEARMKKGAEQSGNCV